MTVRMKKKRPAKKAKGKDMDDSASDDDSHDQTNVEKVTTSNAFNDGEHGYLG